MQTLAAAAFTAHGIRPGQQPNAQFASTMLDARSHVQRAHDYLVAPQAMHLTPDAYAARSLTEAKAGLSLLQLSATFSAPTPAREQAAAAIAALQLGISMQTHTRGLFAAHAIAETYQTAMSHMIRAQNLSTIMY